MSNWSISTGQLVRNLLPCLAMTDIDYGAEREAVATAFDEDAEKLDEEAAQCEATRRPIEATRQRLRASIIREAASYLRGQWTTVNVSSPPPTERPDPPE